VRTDRQRLEDILDAIEAVGRHPVRDRRHFDEDEVLRFFLLKQVEIIGEAAWKLGTSLKTAHPGVPWTRVERCRHVLVHDYFDVDWEILWRILTEHLEPLRVEVEAMLKEPGPHDGAPGA
jgi:uncharacterized protein with HEPN domain